MSTIAPTGHGLPKITVDKLESIGQRRTSLLLTRTAALFVSVFLGLLLTSALADRFWNLSDTTRAILGLSTYAISFVAVLVALFPLRRRWSLSDSARITEERVATLRNKLLSAVELPADSIEPRLGSAELRSELQAVVAEEIRALDLGSVLPWRRIRAIVLAMLGIGLLTGVLTLIPSLNLPQHLWRLLLPIADLPRPSLADIQILDPQPDAAVFALNETPLFRAQVTLPDSERERMPERLDLEIRTNEPQPESLRITMKPDLRVEALPDSDASKPEPTTSLSPSTFFSSLVNIEHASFDYRVVSDIGETRWYSAQAAERPRVDEFAIVVTPPAYSGAAAETTVADSADVEVVAGSQVSWALKSNVSLAQAKLRWQAVDSTITPAESVALAPDDQGAWTFSTLADKSRSFQIDLTSEQGLHSTFPPTYQLSVQADQAPQITWQKPSELTRVIRPRSAAILQVAIADEYPLQRLEQWSRINRGTWRKDVLGTPTSATAEVEWTWEIAVLNAKIGDLIETKIVALDRKGQTGESPLSEWAVSGTELNPSRDPETLVREEIDRLIARLKPIVQGKQSQLKEATEAWRKDVNNGEATALLLREITSSADEVPRLLDDTRAQVESLLSELHNPLTLEEVNLLLDAMTQWTREFRVIQQTLESSINREANDQRSGVLDRFRGRYEHALYSVDRLPLISQALVSHDILTDFSRDLENAWRYQRELLRDEESIGSKIWQREQQILSEYLTRVGQDMGAHSPFLPEGPARGLREWGQMVEQLGERSASLVEEEGIAAHRVQELANEIRNRVNLFQLYSWLPDEVTNLRRELFQHSGKTRDLLIRSMHEWHQERQLAADASVPTAAFLTAMDALWQRRATRYHRADHSTIYAADLGMAHRALEHQIALNTGNPSRVDQRIQQIAEAVGVIESGQRVETARHLLDTILATERFAATGTIARTENPRLWDAFGQQLEWAHENMRGAEALREMASVINGLRWTTAAQSVGQKITPRRWDLDRIPVSAASDLESVRASLLEQETLLQPSVEEARRLLAELSPPIAELAQASADAVEAAQAATEQLQEQLRADEVPNLAERLQQNQSQLDQAREKTSDRLEAALVDRAASQNLLDQRQQKQAQVADLARQLAQAAEQRTTQAAQDAIQEAVQQPTQDPTQDPIPESATAPPVAEALVALQQAQAREAETLQAIAEHFAKESNDPAGESPQANRAETLAQLAQEQELQPELTDRRNSLERDAEALAALSEADPRELLRSLEQELIHDEQMQEELSDIARTLAEQSQRSLEHAAEREQNLRQSLEQSDAVREPLRREFAQELNQALEEAEQIVRRLQNETQEQAQAGEQTPSQEKLTAAAEQLQESIQTAREQVASGLNEDLKQAAQNLNQALQDVQLELQATQETLAANKDESPFEREDQRQQRQNWANQTQDRLADQDRHQADREVQNRQQQEQRAQQGVQQAQQSVSQAEQQLQQYRDQLKSQPDNEWLKQQVPQAEAQVAQQQAVQKTWEGVRQRAEQRTQAAQQARQQQDQRPSSLDAPNPHSELAERLTQQAANRAAELSEDLNQLMNQAGYMAETKASRAELEQAARQQANVQDQIAAAAQDLQQAAAHQERLGAEQSAEGLQQAAQDVTNTANQEPRAAQTQIQQAQASSPDATEPLQANSNDTQQVDQSLQSANAALEQRAEELGQMLGESAEQNRSANQDRSSESNQTSEQNSASEKNTGSQQNGSAEQNSAQNSNANSGENANAKAAENSTQANGQNSNANAPSNSNANSASNPSSNSNSGNSNSPTGNPILSQMDPRAKAELLDQLARQLSRSESGEPSASGESSGQPTAGQSQAALQGLAQSLRRQLQQQRAQQMAQAARTPANSPGQTNGAAMQSGTAAMNGPPGSLMARALATDELATEPVGAWSRLREQKSADVTESQAETVSPRYRRQIENYYKVLSEKSREVK